MTAVGGRSDLDRIVARILSVGIYLSVGLLAIGVVLMGATGISPLDGDAPAFDPGRLPADLVALRPTAFLWAGLIAAIATPAIRVAASLVGYARGGERRMVLISGAILLVIAVAVVLGVRADH